MIFIRIASAATVMVLPLSHCLLYSNLASYRLRQILTLDKNRQCFKRRIRPSFSTTSCCGSEKIPRSWAERDFSMKMIVADIPSDKDIERQLARAQKLLKETESFEKEGKHDKAKSTLDKNEKRYMVTKSRNQDGSGLCTFDGDLMAELSEDEEWQARNLLEMFDDGMINAIDSLIQNRRNVTGDESETLGESPNIDSESAENKQENYKQGKFHFASTPTSKKLADRDEGKAVAQMRLKMNSNDFDKIFDHRNPFIGDF